jgi:predicted RNase H-like nuclease (RuvC/YqgF family)
MERASEALFALKPVTFRYKKGIDPQGLPQFGLVAEDVEEVDPDLVVRDGEGKVNTVRYEAVNAMLLNEFLKAHRKAEEQERKVQQQEATITQLKSDATKQEATISQLKKGMEVFAATLKEQAAQIQKVSAQLEVSKPASQVVLNKP